MANDINIGGAFLDVGVDSSPAEKALASFFKHFDQVGSKAMDLAENISDTVVKAEMLGKKGGEAVNNFAKSYDSVKQKTTEAMKTVDNLRSKIDGVAKGGSASYQMLAGKIDASNKTISDSSKSTLNGMKTDYAAANQAIYADTQKTNALIATSFKQSFGALKSSFNDLKAGFQSLGKSILGIFDKPLNAIQTTFKRVMSVTMKDVTGFFQSGAAQARNAALSQLNAIKTAITSIPEKARSAVNQAKLSLVSGFSSAANATANAISKMGDGLKDLPSKAKNAISGVKNAVVNLPSTAQQAGISIKNALGGAFTTTVAKIKSILPSVKTGIENNVERPSEKASNGIKGMALAFAGIQLAASVVRKAFSVVQSSVGSAISRIDTLNNSTRTFANMGFGAEEVTGTMEDLKKSIDGLPTPLDSAVRGLQMLTASTGNLGKSQKVFAALNNGILGFGGNAEMVDNAIMQLSQALGNGKVDAQTWNSMVNSGMMPVLNALAKQMGITTAQMKEGLSDGTISVDTFQDALIDLNENGGGGLASLQQIAKDSTKGIGTSIANAKTAITKGTTAIILGVSNLLKALTGKDLAELIAESGNKAQAALENIGQKIEGLAGITKKWIDTLKPMLPVVKAIMAAFGAYMGLAVMVKLMGTLAGFVGFNPFVLFIASLVFVAKLLTEAYEKNDKFRQSVDKLLEPFTMLRAMLGAFGEAIKNAFQEAHVKGFLNAFTTYMPKIRDSFVDGLKGLTDTQSKVVAVFVAIATAAAIMVTVFVVIPKVISGAIGAFNILASGVQKVGSAIGFIAANPFVILIAVIAGVVAGFIYLYKTNEKFANSVNNTVGKITAFANALKDSISEKTKAAFEALASVADRLGDAMKKVADVVGGAFSSAFQALSDGIGNIMPTIEALAGKFGGAFSKGLEIAGNLLERMGNEFGKLGGVIAIAVSFFTKFALSALGITGPLGIVIALVVSFLSMWARTGDMSADGITKVFDQISSTISTAADMIAQYLPVIIETVTNVIVLIIEKIAEYLPQFLMVIVDLFTKIVELVAQNLPLLIGLAITILTTLINAFVEALPIIIDVGIQVLTALIQGIVSVLPMLIGAAILLITTIFNLLVENLPIILDAGIKILMALISGIISILPQLIDAAITLIMAIIQALIENLPLILNAGIQILMALIGGIISILPQLIDAAITIILALVQALIDNLPTIIDAGIKLLLALINGIISILPQLIDAALTIIMALAKALIDNLPLIISAGWELLKALAKGALEAIGELLSIVPKIFEQMKEAFNEIDWASIGKNILDGILGGLSKGWGKVKKAAGDLGGNIKDWFEKKMGIASPSKVMIASAVWVPEGVAVGIEKGLPTIKKAMKKVTDTMDKAVKDAKPIDLKANVIKTEHYGMPDASKLNAAAQQATQASDQGMQNNAPQLLNTAAQAAAGVVNSFNSMAPQMSAEGTDWINNFIQGFASQTGTFAAQTQAFGTNTIATLNAFDPAQNQSGLAWINNLSTGFGSVIPGFLAQANGLATQTQTILNSYIPSMYQSGLAWIQNIYNAWNSLVSILLNLVTTTVNSAWSIVDGMQSSFYNAGRALMQNLINGISSMGSALDQTMRGVANQMLSGIEKGVNGVVGGVNYVLKEVESDKSLNTWTAPRYAKGTEAHPGGPAIINDQPGDTYKELVQLPTGESFIAKARNALMWLPKGAKVLNARLTKQFMGFGKSIPKYADGIGDIDIYDYLDDAAGLLKKVVAQKMDLSGVKDIWKGMTNSGVAMMIREAAPFLQTKMDDMFSIGSFDGAVNANGVYQYLVEVAQKVMARFPGFSITSGYRPGDQYHHGQHQAVDIAVPGGYNLPIYREAADYAFEKFPKQVGYVITNGMVRDRMGYTSGGRSGIWSRWADNDHYDHVHISGLLGSGDIFTAGGSSGDVPAGSGVERWRALAIKALKMEGQYSAANLNALLYQMNTESGGNARAINLWDSNAMRGIPSKGLMQVIDPTFYSYARPGYNKNVYDPLSNILAAIRYTLSRYGSLVGGWRGVGYENGALITQEHLAKVGEGNKAEMIIPLTKPERALQLIMQALAYLGRNGGNIISNAANSISTITSNTVSQFSEGVNGVGKLNINMILGTDLAQVVTLLRENNDLLRVIAESDDVIVMDNTIVGRKVAPTVKKEIDRADRTARRGRGDR